MKFRLFISSQSLNLGGRRDTTDEVATIPFHLSLSSAALRESPNPIPVHSLVLPTHLSHQLPFKDIEKPKRRRRTHGGTNGRTDVRENSIPPHAQFAGGYNEKKINK